MVIIISIPTNIQSIVTAFNEVALEADVADLEYPGLKGYNRHEIKNQLAEIARGFYKNYIGDLPTSSAENDLDAIRHTVAAVIATKKFGYLATKIVGDLGENYNGLSDTNNPSEKELNAAESANRDFYHNKLGGEIALKANSWSEAKRMIIKAYYDGTMVTKFTDPKISPVYKVNFIDAKTGNIIYQDQTYEKIRNTKILK